MTENKRSKDYLVSAFQSSYDLIWSFANMAKANFLPSDHHFIDFDE